MGKSGGWSFWGGEWCELLEYKEKFKGDLEVSEMRKYPPAADFRFL